MSKYSPRLEAGATIDALVARREAALWTERPALDGAADWLSCRNGEAAGQQ